MGALMDVPEQSELKRVMSRINTSMALAHCKYGDKFETAYTQLISMSPADEQAREAVWAICDCSDPGESLTAWWHGHQFH